jgi:hypothetical protein
MLFKLTEYARAEVAFVGATISALSKSRGGLLGEISTEATSRTGTTQVTTDSGETVEFHGTEIAAKMTLDWEDIAAGRVESLLTTLDEAAEQHHEQVTKWVLENIERLSEATGNTVDASDKSLFDAVYEMYEKVELSFEDDGSISKGFAWVMHPDTAEKFKRLEEEMTSEQREKLDALIDRKRKEFFARRRRRELS